MRAGVAASDGGRALTVDVAASHHPDQKERGHPAAVGDLCCSCSGGGGGDCGGGCGADEALTTMCFPYHRKRARWQGSQTRGVPATLGLNVQMDGGRKMLQNCSKTPITNQQEANEVDLRVRRPTARRKQDKFFQVPPLTDACTCIHLQKNPYFLYFSGDEYRKSDCQIQAVK